MIYMILYIGSVMCMESNKDSQDVYLTIEKIKRIQHDCFKSEKHKFQQNIVEQVYAYNKTLGLPWYQELRKIIITFLYCGIIKYIHESEQYKQNLYNTKSIDSSLIDYIFDPGKLKLLDSNKFLQYTKSQWNTFGSQKSQGCLSPSDAKARCLIADPPHNKAVHFLYKRRDDNLNLKILFKKMEKICLCLPQEDKIKIYGTDDEKEFLHHVFADFDKLFRNSHNAKINGVLQLKDNPAETFHYYMSMWYKKKPDEEEYKEIKDLNVNDDYRAPPYKRRKLHDQSLESDDENLHFKIQLKTIPLLE